MWFVVFQIIETLLGTKVPSLSDPFKFRYLKALSICIIPSCPQSENRAIYGDSAAWKSLHELPVKILLCYSSVASLTKTSIYHILHLTQLLNTAFPPSFEPWPLIFNYLIVWVFFLWISNIGFDAYFRFVFYLFILVFILSLLHLLYVAYVPFNIPPSAPSSSPCLCLTLCCSQRPPVSQAAKGTPLPSLQRVHDLQTQNPLLQEPKARGKFSSGYLSLFLSLFFLSCAFIARSVM